MGVLELIARLQAVVFRGGNKDLKVAATFESPSGNSLELHVVSLNLAAIFFAPEEETVILHFKPIPNFKKALDLAAKLQLALDSGEVEIIEVIIGPNEETNEEGLPF
jgi:hypothetical protein